MAKMSIGSVLDCVLQHAAVGIFVSIFVVSALNMSRGPNKDNMEVEESRDRVGEVTSSILYQLVTVVIYEEGNL